MKTKMQCVHKIGAYLVNCTVDQLIYSRANNVSRTEVSQTSVKIQPKVITSFLKKLSKI